MLLSLLETLLQQYRSQWKVNMDFRITRTDGLLPSLDPRPYCTEKQVVLTISQPIIQNKPQLQINTGDPRYCNMSPLSIYQKVC